MRNDCGRIVVAILTWDCSAADKVISRWACASDQHRAAKRRTPAGFRRSLLAYALMRALLEDSTGIDGRKWQVYATSNGKPYVCLPSGQMGPAVSISHSVDIVVAAVTKLGPVGIDVEYHRPNRPFTAIAETTFGRTEQLEAAASAIDFYRIWALREALSKATGQGLSQVTNGMDLVHGGPRIGAWQQIIEGQTSLLAYTEPIANYSLAAATIPKSPMTLPDWSLDRLTFWQPPFPSPEEIGTA